MTDLKLAHVLPSAPEVERAVIGALLLNPDAWPPIADQLHGELFGDDNLRTVYTAMSALYHKGDPVDLITVVNRLRSDAVLDNIGGAVFLAGLQNAVSNTRNLGAHVRILTEKLIARKLILIGSRAERMGMESPDALEALDTLSTQVTDLYQLTQPTRMRTAADGLAQVIDRTDPNFLSFGIPALDKIATFRAGVPSVFAGRPGIGKSIFSLEVLWHNTLRGPVIGFFPEMTHTQVQSRILAKESGVPYSRILRKDLSDRDMDLLTSTMERIADRMRLLKVDDTSGITPDQIRARVERGMKAEGVIAFAVDHLHKMRTGNGRVDQRDFDRIGQCMNGITEVAKRSDLPCLVMCQLNRQVESRGGSKEEGPGKRPKLTDLRSTGEIEQDAALVGLLYRDGYYEATPPEVDRLEIIVAKNRDGAVGEVATTIMPAINHIGDDLPKHAAAPF